MAQYTIEIYRLDVQENRFERIDVLDNGIFYGLEYSKRLNGIGECRFSLSPFSSKATKRNFVERANQILIKRDKQPVWVGPFFNYEGGIDSTNDSITFNAYSYMFHLVTRFTDQKKIYTQTDQFAIAKNLIDTVQSRAYGGLRIISDIVSSGVDRDRTYEFTNISDAIIAFSNIINGYDHEFVPVMDADNMLSSIRFKQYYPRMGSIRKKLPKLQLGKNIQSLGFATDGEIYNSGISKGSGTGEGSDAIFSTNDPSSMSTLQKVYTRLETVRVQSGTATTQELDEDHYAYMNSYSIPRVKLSLQLNDRMRPYHSELNLGDSLVVDAKATDIDPYAGDLVSYQGYARVNEITTSVDENGAETVTPTVVFYQ